MTNTIPKHSGGSAELGRDARIKIGIAVVVLNLIPLFASLMLVTAGASMLQPETYTAVFKALPYVVAPLVAVATGLLNVASSRGQNLNLIEVFVLTGLTSIFPNYVILGMVLLGDPLFFLLTQFIQ